MTAQDVRKIIKKEFPDLKFTVKKVSFEDLARCSCFVVTSPEWGTCCGGPERYQKVVELFKDTKEIIVQW